MQATLPETPIIRTKVLKRLELLVDQVAQTAELAIVKGPAGIGKTFAIDHIKDTCPTADIFKITARTEISFNIKWMANELLDPYGSAKIQAAESMQALWTLIARRPFASYPSRSVVIIDEAQEIKPAVLNSFRGLFDMGQEARQFGGNLPAFGMVLVGNSVFLDRSGAQKKAAYEPLLSRVEYSLNLGRPTRADYEHYVQSLPQISQEIQADLVEIGMSKGSIRAVAKAWLSLMRLSQGKIPSRDTLQAVVSMMGGA